MLDIDLTGKRALVTGGSRGVGRATAELLARAGADVGLSYRTREDAAARVVAALGEHGARAWAERGDVAEPETAERLIRRAEDEFGGLDLFVANAGVWPPEDVSLAEMDVERWRRTLAVNLDGVFYTARAAARAIDDDGRIVLVGSTAGQRGEAGHAGYAASKGALQALVKGVAIELAPRGVTVNAVAPGWIDTDMTAVPYAGGGRERIEREIPLGRVASPEDVAGPIVFLCSELARHITGEIMNVNGGAVLAG